MNKNEPIRIFLDIDGVLNTESQRDRNCHSFAPSGAIGLFTPCVKSFLAFLENLDEDYEIILSSSWQEEIQNDTKDGLFIKNEFDYFGIDITGFTNPCKYDDFDEDLNELRGKSIKRFISDQSRFVIFDDREFDFQQEGLSNHLVKTNPKKGLLFTDITNAHKILGIP